ncbi:MAG: hypothetical protein C3F07_15220 [Anaerolineales bacterium]|nr:hypothetical protein [Anaerolineae bacterium]PWB70971.1 MAG: hypothetical protein C3F07_15220 [Anaerolineales bacterium]
MENKGALTKVLSIAGTVLVWLPILAPILFGAISFIADGVFRFDYLMPAELFFLVIIGGGLLLWAAVRSHLRWKLFGWTLAIAAALFFGMQALAEVTGLADGSTPMGGWQWMLVLGTLVLYIVTVIAIDIGGVLLLRDLFKPGQKSTVVH